MTTSPVPYDALLEHASFVRGLARSLLRDDAAADDAVQETWLAATKSPPRQAGKERSWLSKVLRNVVRQQRRSAGRRARHERAAAEDVRKPKVASATEELAARDEIFRNVAGAVMSLPEHYRAVVMLRFYDALPPRKIAAKLDLPVETVRTRLKRAVALLRSGLDDRYGGDRRKWQAALAPFAAGALLSAGASAVLLVAVTVAAIAGTGWLAWRALAPADPGPSGTPPPAVHVVDDGSGPSGPPVLFGRAVSKQAGSGSAIGRVLHLQTGEPVDGATIRLTRVGADSAVEAQVRSTADGTFHASGVVAAWPLRLTVEATGIRPRVLPPFEVEADGALDLGTIWVGDPGRLTGRVVDWRDAGVAGALVEVHPVSYPFASFPPSPEALLVGLDRAIEPLAATRADGTGAFGFTALPPGPLSLIVRAPGFRQGVRRVVMTADGLAGGRLEIRLVETRAVYGTVTDSVGDPVVGARVALLPALQAPGDFYARQFAVSDAAGRFRFDAPPPTEQVRVVVAAEGYPTWLEVMSDITGPLRLVLERGVDLQIRVVEAASARPLAGARLTATIGAALKTRPLGAFVVSGITDAEGTVSLVAVEGSLHLLMVSHETCGSVAYSPAARGESRALDLGEHADGRTHAGTNTWTIQCAPATRITGTITTSEGQPLAGARCRTMSRGGASVAVLTDERGRYVLPAIIEGPLALLIEAAGHVQPPSSMMVMPGPSGEDRVLDVRMERAARIMGRVVDRAGSPVAGVEVMLVPAGPMMAMPGAGVPASSVTGTDGRYVLDGARRGSRCRVAGRGRGFVSALGDVFPVQGDGTTNVPTLVLRPGVAVTVLVETPTGERAPDARIAAWVEEPRSRMPQVATNAEGRLDTRTDEQGRARIVDLPSGTLKLIASLRGYGTATGELTIDPAKPPGEDVVLRLTHAARLRGRVLDADSKPVPDVVVIVEGREGDGASPRGMPSFDALRTSSAALAGADGRFELNDLPGAGRYRMRAVGPGITAEAQVADTHADEAILRVTRSAQAMPDLDEMMEQVRRMSEGLEGEEGSEEELRRALERLREWAGEQGPR